MAKTSMQTRKEVTEKQKKEYAKATKKQKGVILDAVCLATGLSRDRAGRLLRNSRRSKRKYRRKETRGRKPVYGLDEQRLLRRLWAMLDCVCGLRLKAAIPPVLDALMRFGEIDERKETIAKLKRMSVSTINRLLKKTRDEFIIKGRATTKPGTLLKSQIPVRLGDEWDDTTVGFVEIDLVAHCGDSTRGEYINTLDVTDIATTWTETRAVLNKAQKHVFEALMHIQIRAPFDYAGIDSDNGSEFINYHLYHFCQTYGIVFTRTRSYRKNDNAHIEEKNWSIVRKHMGYSRFEGREALDLINDYYDCLRLYTNFFLPTVKLTSKQRIGSRTVKRYDKPKTPYARMLACPDVDKPTKKRLQKTFESLNPAKLKRDMLALGDRLDKIAIPYDGYH
jgi:hypothetical protein